MNLKLKNNTKRTASDRASIKEAILELVTQDPEFMEEFINKIQLQINKSKSNRIEPIVNEDFKNYECVYKALA